MGILILGGMIVLVLFMGIVVFSLLSMAQKGEQVYDQMYRGEEIATPVNPLDQPTPATLSPTSSGKVQPRRDLNASTVVLLARRNPKSFPFSEGLQGTIRGK
jgi:hypothetical protein